MKEVFDFPTMQCAGSDSTKFTRNATARRGVNEIEESTKGMKIKEYPRLT